MSTNAVDTPVPETLPADLVRDVQNVSRIPIVPTLLDVICRTTGMGFAAIARVTESHWVACSVKDDILFGLKPGGELKLETTICHSIRQAGKPVVIDHVAKHPDYVGHHTPAMYGFQSYISVPIARRDGRFFGTLCAIDPRPRLLDTPETRGMFALFAELISYHLESVEQLTVTEGKLAQAVETGVLRDQFIAILGHDLRNPVSAISNGAQMLQRMDLEPDALKLAGVIKNSAFRMSELIENVLDFARSQLGEGFPLKRRRLNEPEPLLMQVINELRAVWPGRKIETQIRLTLPLYCDAGRIGQLLSNLLGNALAYGTSTEPVRVVADVSSGQFELSVTNAGSPISKETLRRLFQPFARGEGKAGQQGLGLGLYIAYQIASRHDGDIEVESNDHYTRFTFRMPLQPELA